MKLFKNKSELGKVEIGFIVVVIIALAAAGWYAWKIGQDKQANITNFDECVAAGNPVMESFPEQCAADGRTFTRTNTTEQDLIVADQPDESRIPLAELPDGLQNTVKQARSQSCAIDADTDESELDANTTAHRGAFIDGMFAQVNLECPDKGLNGLFRFENNAWVFVAATEQYFMCADLVSHNIPVTYIGECLEDESGAPVANPVAS